MAETIIAALTQLIREGIPLGHLQRPDNAGLVREYKQERAVRVMVLAAVTEGLRTE